MSLLPFLIIVAAVAVAVYRRKGSVSAMLPGSVIAPPTIDPWKSQVLTDRINAHVRSQYETEAINLALQAFGEAEPSPAPASKPRRSTARKSTTKSTAARSTRNKSA